MFQPNWVSRIEVTQILRNRLWPEHNIYNAIMGVSCGRSAPEWKSTKPQRGEESRAIASATICVGYWWYDPNARKSALSLGQMNETLQASEAFQLQLLQGCPARRETRPCRRAHLSIAYFRLHCSPANVPQGDQHDARCLECGLVPS